MEAGEQKQTGYVVERVRNGVRIGIGPEARMNSADLAAPVAFGMVEVEGCASDLEHSTKERSSALSGQPGSAAALFAFASQIEKDHEAAGHAFVRALVPPQLLSRGAKAKIIIVRLAIEKIDVQSVPGLLRDHVLARLGPLIGRRDLTRSDLAAASGRLQLDIGAPVRFELRPGSAADRVELVVVGPARPYTFEASAGTLISKPFKREVLTGAGRAASLFGFGELFSAAASVGRREELVGTAGTLWAAAGQVRLPFGDGGHFLELLGSGARETRLLGTTNHLIDYRYGRAGIRLGTSFFSDGGGITILRGGADYIGEDLSTLYRGLTWPLDSELRFETGAGRVGVMWLYNLFGVAPLEVTGEFSGGSARSSTLYRPALAGLSFDTRTERDLAKLEGKFRLTIPYGDTRLILAARGQASFSGRLTPAEQIQLFSPELAMPISPETSQGDSGAIARAELAHAIAAPWFVPGAVVEPYLFTSAGLVSEKRDRTLPGATVRGFSAGGGLRLSTPPGPLSPEGTDFGLEAFRQVTDGPIPDHSGLYLRVVSRF